MLIAVGSSPPSPTPARVRPRPKTATESAIAQTPEASENRITQDTMSFLRPIRSATVPAVRAPTSMPKVA